MAQPPGFPREFLDTLQQQTLALHDAPDGHQPAPLSSTPYSFRLGTGAALYADALLPALLRARREVILVTCFWARSRTLTELCKALEALAAHRRRILSEGESPAAALPPLRIRICLSSTGLFQKLLHTWSPDGYVYPPRLWPSKLGLPEEARLRDAGIDLQVKSLFFLPFSVMHPKYLVIDRATAFVPSCNVSWEAWLEGCVEITGGEAVRELLRFYAATWERRLLDAEEAELPVGGGDAVGDLAVLVPDAGETGSRTPAGRSAATDLVLFEAAAAAPIPTMILPSSCHRNPHFRPFPWQAAPPPPPTALNTALLLLFEQAERHIYVQTPNLTCAAVVSALLAATDRGVDVSVVTSRSMMLLEQLLTAGTTTSRCVGRMIRRYRQNGRLSEPGNTTPSSAQQKKQGALRISYFHPLRRVGDGNGTARTRPADEERGRISSSSSNSGDEEPVHSHLKLTIVDGEYTVLGSGNMDRASWYTSQELGVLFYDAGFAGTVKASVERVLEGRLDTVFDSRTDSGGYSGVVISILHPRLGGSLRASFQG